MNDKLYEGTHEFSLSVNSNPTIRTINEKISLSGQEKLELMTKAQVATISGNDIVENFVNALKENVFTPKELGFFIVLGFNTMWKNETMLRQLSTLEQSISEGRSNE